MFDSIVLDVVIGLVFIYLLYSLMVTLIGEIISSNINLRGIILLKSIKRMLNDSGTYKGSFAQKFYAHPTIKYLAANNIISWPSYISADTFSTTVISLLRKRKTASTVMEEIKIGVFCHDFKSAPETRRQLLGLIEEANGDLDTFKRGLESWYNETQDRATGWFKRRMQLILFIIGFVIAALFNINSFKIAQILTNNNEARYKVLAMASDSATKAGLEKIVVQEQQRKQEQWKREGKVDSTKAPAASGMDTMPYHQYKELTSYSEQLTDILGLGLKSAPAYHIIIACIDIPIPKHFFPWNKDFWGILITALALSLGAPFWFGLLNKLLVLKGSGKNPDEEKARQAEEGKDTFKSVTANLEKDQNKHHLSEHVAKDPVLYAIALNEQLWKKIPGVIAVNKDYTLTTNNGLHAKTPCIEITHSPEADTSSIQSKVDVDFQGAIHHIPIEKRKLGYAKPHFPDDVQQHIQPQKPELRVTHADNKDPNKDWGTITGVVKDNSRANTYLLLSCAHVLQGNNTGGALNGSTGVKGDQDIVLGTLKFYLHSAIYDVAWAEVAAAYKNKSGDDFKNLFIRPPRMVNSDDADAMLNVKMEGAMSGSQSGKLWSVNAKDIFNFPGGKLPMFNLLKITSIDAQGNRKAISQGGDSGALLKDDNDAPIGIVIGGNDEFTYAIKLADIFNDYKSTLGPIA